jgi:hypothetical protein
MENKSENLRDARDEHVEQSTHNARDAHIAVHTDTYDIDEDALGKNLPKHYYMSPGFIGTVTVCQPTTVAPSANQNVGVMSRQHQQLLGLDHAFKFFISYQRIYWTIPKHHLGGAGLHARAQYGLPDR